MLEIGSLVDGKYKVLNKIGQGGMSVVYLAMNEKANKQWAIKEVRKDGIQNFEIVRQGLVAETDILKKLSHPNLPSIVDVIDKDDAMLIVMDYIQGKTFQDILEDEGAQPQDLVVKWAIQMCDVLGYLHTRTPPIIYRDMKPSNVMLRPDGNITIIDFGTAREFKERNVADTTCLGTRGYAAPEQFGGQGQTDARTDIYCLGATMYHLVTGHNPGQEPYQILPIRRINPALSNGLEKIIARCTQSNPPDRYQSCAELIYALEHYYELDDLHRAKHLRRLGLFAAASVLSLVCFGVGVGGGAMANRTNVTRFEGLIEQSVMAEESLRADGELSGYASVDEYRFSKCLEAIQLRPEAGAGYLTLVELCSMEGEDGKIVFTQDESSRLDRVWSQNKELVRENSESDYVEVCYQIGVLYWHYADYNNEADRMKRALPYFEQVVEVAPESYSNHIMAEMYRNIGRFQYDIVKRQSEGSDTGDYAAVFSELSGMVDLVAASGESGIVKLETYRLAVNSILTYVKELRNDGIERQEVLTLFDRAMALVDDISPQTATEAKREALLRNQEMNRRTIEEVYDAGRV